MGESQISYLDVFPAWLRSLGEDAEKLGGLSAVTSLSEGARQVIVGGVNYIFKSLDLVPDGIDDIGYMDDAFVLRVAAELAMREDLAGLSPDQLRALNRLGEESDVARRFLGADFGRLESYVSGLRKVAARGRSVQDIVHDANTRGAFLSDLRG